MSVPTKAIHIWPERVHLIHTHALLGQTPFKFPAMHDGFISMPAFYG